MSDQPDTIQRSSPGPESPTGQERTDRLGRRAILRVAGVAGVGAAGAGVLAACGSSGTPSTGTAASSSSTTAAASSTSSGSETSSGSSSSAATSATSAAADSPYKVADIPVGGGKAYPDVPLVITQPAAGEFKAFNGTCTHQGCPVTKVENGKIVCPCHNSMFDISTGEPTSGSQAKKALAAKTATVSGDSVVVA